MRANITRELQDRIREMERSGQRGDKGSLSTGFTAIDRLLSGGFQHGTLIEWMGVGDGDGSGAATLALTVAAHLLQEDGALIVVDRTRDFYPPAAHQLGIPLNRTVVVQPDTQLAALWAWEQSLRCPGVAVTFGWMDAIDDRVSRRLQLAAEAGGGLGFVLRSPDCRSGPSWAATRIGVQPREAATRWATFGAEPAPDSLSRRLRLSLARGQHGIHGTAIEVEIAP